MAGEADYTALCHAVAVLKHTAGGWRFSLSSPALRSNPMVADPAFFPIRVAPYTNSPWHGFELEHFLSRRLH
jgi:hypothetical protein